MEKSAVYRGVFAIGVLLFAASTGVGLAYEVATQRRLPRLLPSPFEHAASLLGQGETDEFVSEYRTAATIAPHVAWSHLQLAFALNRAGDAAGALLEFQAAARLDPDSRRAHHNAAVLALGAGDLPTARRHGRQLQRIAHEAGERLDPFLVEALGPLEPLGPGD